MSKAGDYLLARGWRIYQRKRKPLGMGYSVLWIHDRNQQAMIQAEAIKQERTIEREHWKENQRAKVPSVLGGGATPGIQDDRG